MCIFVCLPLAQPCAHSRHPADALWCARCSSSIQVRELIGEGESGQYTARGGSIDFAAVEIDRDTLDAIARLVDSGFSGGPEALAANRCANSWHGL